MFLCKKKIPIQRNNTETGRFLRRNVYYLSHEMKNMNFN